MKATSLVAVLFFLVACLGSVRAQPHHNHVEIPIERCYRPPVVAMKVAAKNGGFLLDTAPTHPQFKVFLPSPDQIISGLLSAPT